MFSIGFNLMGHRHPRAKHSPPSWNPAALSPLAWYDISDVSTLFQDIEQTVPVTTDGDPVGMVLDKSGNGYHISQSIMAARPTYRTGRYLPLDRVRRNDPNPGTVEPVCSHHILVCNGSHRRNPKIEFLRADING